MRNVSKLTFIMLCSMLLCLNSGLALAKVSGPCVNCHTMHNSQEGSDVNADPNAPFGALVNNNCLGCHTTTGSDPRVNGFPYVKGSGLSDINCLAGGFFPSSGNDGTDNVGKAHSLDSQVIPPGSGVSGPAWYTGDANGLSCAGSSGCHGSQSEADEMKAVKGGHHSPTVYRILYAYNGGSPAGVVGTGAADYEEDLNKIAAPGAGTDLRTPANEKHNIYKAGTANNTISKLCANCHGDFHGAGTGTASPWQRHPTDVELPADWAAQLSTGIVTNEDCKFNPFGFEDHTSTTGTKLATCLSCHRAHGTDNYDLLRFAYSNITGRTDTGTLQEAGSGLYYGCLGCHSKQR